YEHVVGRVDAPPPLLPARHWLGRPAPNPSRSAVLIRFGIARETAVSLALYDPSGRMVRGLVAERLPAGVHEARWDGRDASGHRVASGLYFVRLAVDGQAFRSRVVLMP